MRLIRVARALRSVIVPAVVAALVAFPLGVANFTLDVVFAKRSS